MINYCHGINNVVGQRPGDGKNLKLTDMKILIFKTNIKFKKQVNDISKHLKDQPLISKWNVDLLDVDKVLRIESPGLPAPVIEKLVKSAGYYSEEFI